jgi:hypothetical protein
MASSMAFTTGTRKKDPIKFTVDGTPFEFVPPKQADIFLETVSGGTIISLTKETFDWLQEGLDAHLVRDEGDTSPLPSQYFIDRLKDKTDDFDVPDLESILEWLQKRSTGRPTT